MSLRLAIRKLRLYYKSLDYLRGALGPSAPLLSLPFRGTDCHLVTHNGIALKIPAGAWPLLPTMCKLADIGATTTVEPDAKRICLQGLTYYTPLEPRGEGVFFREIFQDDVYELRDCDLSGAVVVDIGAHVGDLAVWLASRGAIVHAFEPSRACGGFLRRNMAANKLSGQVVFHNVGLSNRGHTESWGSDHLDFVEGGAYALEHVPRNVDLLKVDCEGCEYYLFDIPGWLEHLAPRRIAMEFYHGASALEERLVALGYEVRVSGDPEKVGYIHAKRPGHD